MWIRAETIPRVTRIRQIMCLEESFCPFTRDALNFRQPKIYAPHHPAVSRFALSLSRHHCAMWRSALSFCSITAHAHRTALVTSPTALVTSFFNQSGLQFLQINTPDPMPTGHGSCVNGVKLFSTAFILHRWWFNTPEEKYPILSLNVI